MSENKPLEKPSLTRALINLEIALIDLTSKEAKEYIQKAINDIELVNKYTCQVQKYWGDSKEAEQYHKLF